MTMRDSIKTWPDSNTGHWVRFIAQVALVPILTGVLIVLAMHEERLDMSSAKIVANDLRIGFIENNRFTSQDANQLTLMVAQKDAELLALINEIRQTKAINEERIDRMRKDLAELQVRVGERR